MNKLDLASRLARESHRSRAKAADQVDALVYELLRDLKDSSEEAGENSTPGHAAKRKTARKGKT